MSLLALKLATVVGCKVIITSSSDAKLEKVLTTAGTFSKAVSTINYSNNPQWAEEAIRLNGGNGVDIVIENGGTSSLIQSLAATAKRGIISQVGYLGKQDPKDLEGLLALLIDKTVTLRFVSLSDTQFNMLIVR